VVSYSWGDKIWKKGCARCVVEKRQGQILDTAIRQGFTNAKNVERHSHSVVSAVMCKDFKQCKKHCIFCSVFVAYASFMQKERLCVACCAIRLHKLSNDGGSAKNIPAKEM